MVTKCLTVKSWESKNSEYWVYDGMCGSENHGYIFNDFSIGDLPITVEHIIDYVF